MSIEISKETVNHFKKKLDQFLEQCDVNDNREDCIDFLNRNPMFKIWFDQFGFEEGWNGIKREGFVDLLEKCESPVEQMLLVAMRISGYREGVIGFQCRIKSDQDLISCPPHPDYVIIESQVKVDKYRVDFRFTYKDIKEIFRDVSNHIVKTVLVECDGHDFHEKTKLQASKDKARDRKLTSLGYSLLRFTGSEIWNDPFKCCEEIYDFLQALPGTLNCAEKVELREQQRIKSKESLEINK